MPPPQGRLVGAGLALYTIDERVPVTGHLIDDDNDREIGRDQVMRVRRVMRPNCPADMDAVQGPPGWRIHQLTGDRAGTWSVSVTGNWRITFTLEAGEICNLNLEDYH